ncbi:MAG: RNB domain-containing ribonuclease [Gammaproteobacteria bacterium]
MIRVGSLIEYLDNNRFICALVTGEKDKRFRLLKQNGREVILPPARIVHSSKDSHPLSLLKEELQRMLKKTDASRQELMAAVDLEEMWELTAAEPSNVFTPNFLAELCFGTETDDDRVASFLRCVFADTLFFKYKDGNIIAHPPEVTAQQRERQEKERRRQRLLASGAAALTRIWNSEETGEWPEQTACFKLLRDYYLFGNDAEEYQTAKDMLKQARLTGAHDVYRLLVKAGVWRKNENIPVLRHNISTGFSETVLNHTESLPERINVEALLNEGRSDFRNLPLLTIDGAATRDFDDALHVEKQGDNFLVGIHIADVGQVVKPDDPLFQEALARGSSLYFPEGVIPMLPKSVSENYCSLIAGEPRAAVSLMVLLSPTGETIEYRVVPSIVTVKHQLSYAEVNRDMGIDPQLPILAELSNKLREMRLENGALLLPMPDVVINLSDEERIDVSLADTETPGRVLVSEFMILANHLAARYVADREVHGLFRSQPPPHQRLIHGLDKDLFINIRQRKHLNPMLLATSPAPHSGIGASCYTTITSPIRRLADLIMQQQITHLAQRKGSLYTLKEMKSYLALIKETLTRLNAAKQLRHRYWLLKYLEQNAAKTFDALIIEKKPHRMHVVLTDLLLDCDLPPKQMAAVKPGDIVQVRIAKVSPLGNVLKLTW